MDIRDSYKVFPKFTQNYITWVTGKALPNQKPLFQLNWFQYFICTFSIFCLGIYTGYLNFIHNNNNLIVMLISWGLILASSRRLAAVVLHQCVHTRFSGNKNLDRFFGELVTTVMVTQDFLTYQKDHCIDHHGPKTFATNEDPIVKFFTAHGIREGLSKNKLWTNFFITIFSPLFHLKFLIARIKYNLTSKSTVRVMASLIYFSLWGVVIYNTTNGMLMFLVVFFIPQIILYQVSAFVEICSEHAWFEPHDEKLPEKFFYVDRSWGRFSGSPYPNQKNRPFDKLKWYISTIFYHLPVRLFILAGDLPQHDYHHRKPLDSDWTIAAYKRQYDIDNNQFGDPDYREIWGLHNALSHVFGILSKSKSKDTHKTYSI